MVQSDLTLKDAWVKAMCDVLYSQQTQHVENYRELINYHTQFGFKEIFSLKQNQRINDDYAEMHKVFFSNEDNAFGHNYAEAVRTPLSEVKNPVEAVSLLLKENESTRKAVFTFVPYAEKKIPCISTVQFLLRNKKLNIVYNSRGQDIFRKFPCDAMCIAEYGMRIAKQNDYELGTIYANIASAHVYDANIEEARQCIAENQVRNVILTGNVHKYEPYTSFLREHGVEVMIYPVELTEIQSMDSEEVVKAKAKAAYENVGFPVWVDDVSLYLEAYPNFPAAYTKSFFKNLGVTGIADLLRDKSHQAAICCMLCLFDGEKYNLVKGEEKGGLDFSRKVENPKMPLSSIFVSEESEAFAYRKKALSLLIDRVHS